MEEEEAGRVETSTRHDEEEGARSRDEGEEGWPGWEKGRWTKRKEKGGGGMEAEKEDAEERWGMAISENQDDGGRMKEDWGG